MRLFLSFLTVVCFLMVLSTLARAQNGGCINAQPTTFLDGANTSYTPIAKNSGNTNCGTQTSPPATFKMGYYTDGTTYSNSLSAVSNLHDTKAKAVAAAIRPLNPSGANCTASNPVSASCAVVMAGVGFSNKQYEDCSTADTVTGSTTFPSYNCTSYSFNGVFHSGQTAGSPTINTDIIFVPLAQGSMTTDKWAESLQFNNGVPLENANNLNAGPWGPVLGAAAVPPGSIVNSFITHLGANPLQVQVIYLKTADVYPWTGGPSKGPTGDNDTNNARGQLNQLGHTFPCLTTDVSSTGLSGRTGGSEVCFNVAQLGTMLRFLKIAFPNLKLVFLTSRMYPFGATPQNINADPYAFEYAFAVQQLIRAQIVQADNGGSTDPVAGDLSYTNAPVAVWGPYFYAGQCSGTFADVRSDGLCYSSSDMAADQVHPAQGAITKIVSGFSNWAGEMSWFQNSPFASPWFNPAGATPTPSPTPTATPTTNPILWFHP